MRIDQVGLAAGTIGRARTDGLATGAKVTLTNTGSGSTTEYNLFWVPPGDTTAVSSLAQDGGDHRVWSFDPTASRFGSYRIEMIEDKGLETEIREVRIFGIRLPVTGILIPALNELADPSASLLKNGSAQIDASENNATDFAGVLAPLTYAGWFRAIQELYMALEGGIGGSAGTLATVLGNGASANAIEIEDGADPTAPQSLTTKNYTDVGLTAAVQTAADAVNPHLAALSGAPIKGIGGGTGNYLTDANISDDEESTVAAAGVHFATYPAPASQWGVSRLVWLITVEHGGKEYTFDYVTKTDHTSDELREAYRTGSPSNATGWPDITIEPEMDSDETQLKITNNEASSVKIRVGYVATLEKKVTTTGVVLTMNVGAGGSGPDWAPADGTYTNVPLTGGSGIDLIVDYTVTGSALVSMTVVNGGSGYVAAEVVTDETTVQFGTILFAIGTVS